MKRNLVIWIGCVVLMMFTASCTTTDNETKKKEAKPPGGWVKPICIRATMHLH